MQIYWNKRERFLKKKKKSLTPTASFWKPQHGRRFIVLEHDTYMAAVTSCGTLYCFRALSKSQNWPSRPVGSLRNQPSFCDATTGFPAKWRLRNSVLLTRQLPDLGCASDCRAVWEICFNHSDLGSDASSVWKLYTRSSDVILRGN